MELRQLRYDDTGDVPARDTAVLIDGDTTSCSSWNAYAGQPARDTGPAWSMSPTAAPPGPRSSTTCVAAIARSS
ncbi:hypothetical protein ACWD4N_40345, partial [Streptomyces sp. NPDC002586]